MSDEPPARKSLSDRAPANPDRLEQMKLVYDYTKFHIGLYLTLIGGLATAYALGNDDTRTKYLPWFVVIVILLLVAGICGAVIATSILDVHGDFWFWDQKPGGEKRGDFRDEPVGWIRVKLRKWARVEHIAFWLAVFVALAALLTLK